MTSLLEQRTLERITRRVFPGSKLLRAWALSGGISAQMTTLEARLPGGELKKMILRCPAEAALHRNPRAAEDEFHVLQAVQALGVGAPAPLHLEREGGLLSTAGLVMEYIDGALEYCPADAIDYVRQMAEHLAKIHSVNVEALGLSFLPLVTSCPESLNPERVKNGVHDSVSLTAGPVISRQENGTAVGQAGSPVQDDGAPGMQGQHQVNLATRNKPALLHGDFWPGNLIWRSSQLTAVIDWEDACLGDPLYDLAIARLDVLCIFGEPAMLAFTTQYQARSKIDFSRLPYWDLCAAQRYQRLAGCDLARWAEFYHPFGRTDITAETIHAHIKFFTAQALEQLATG